MHGPPGGGKSYGMVHWLITNFCVPLRDGGFVLDPAKHVRIITNISSLKIPHEDFQTCLDEAGGFANFFTKEYQSKFSHGWHLIYLIDEAQQWFRARRSKLSDDNLLFFEWARHEGVDFWLATQHIKKLDFEVACLAEVVTRALPRTTNVSKELTYVSETYEGVELESYRLWFDQEIADQYKSEERKEAVQIRNPIFSRWIKSLAVASIFVVIGLYFAYTKLSPFFHPQSLKKSSSASVSKKSASGQPASQTGSPSPAGLLNGVQSQTQQVEYYMYRLDYLISGGVLYLRLGISWIPYNKQFPYLVVLKGKSYFAVIPSILVNSLDDGSRALPIRIKPKTEG